MYRRTFPLVFGGSFLALVALFVALVFSADALAAPSSAPPGGAIVAQATATPGAAGAPTPAAAQVGRPLERRDWVNHIPLFCAMTMLVILVDAAVIGKVVYDRARARRRPVPQV